MNGFGKEIVKIIKGRIRDLRINQSMSLQNKFVKILTMELKNITIAPQITQLLASHLRLKTVPLINRIPEYSSMILMTHSNSNSKMKISLSNRLMVKARRKYQTR